MDNKETNNTPTKSKTRNLLLNKNEGNHIFSNTFSNNDELIKYINELSKIIKIYYKLNIINFKQINYFFEQETGQKNKKVIKSTIKNIEDSFNKFYQNAKDVFKKMKEYRAQQIYNQLKNRRGKSLGNTSDKNKLNNILNKTNYNIKTNNMSISNNIIHNDTININGNNLSMSINTNDNNNNNNDKLIYEKLLNENKILKKKIDDLEKKELDNNSNINKSIMNFDESFISNYDLKKIKKI